MKALKPSMREKKRYMLIKGEVRDIEKAILDGIGTLGMSKTGLGWVKSGKDNAVISVNRNMVDAIRACFALWPGKINIARISGTLKGLKK